MNRKRVSKAVVHQPAAQFYDRFVEAIKERIRSAQIKAALAANAQLVLHYWEIGRDILASQKREGWGTRVIDRLAADLQREFPKLSGYSARNLKYMRAFAQAWPDREIVQQLAAQIPWGQNCVLLDRLKDAVTRELLHPARLSSTVESRQRPITHQLEHEAARTAGQSCHRTFLLRCRLRQSDLAREILKDPYIFKPAPLDESVSGRALESALVARL